MEEKEGRDGEREVEMEEKEGRDGEREGEMEEKEGRDGGISECMDWRMRRWNEGKLIKRNEDKNKSRQERERGRDG